MPPFEPNEYLFEKHADKGNERWEIFAWAVRDAMMKSGHFQPIDETLKSKFKYEEYMRCLPGALEPSITDSLENKLLLNASKDSELPSPGTPESLSRSTSITALTESSSADLNNTSRSFYN